MRSDIRTYKCVECFGRFKTHADLQGDNRICVTCRVIKYQPPPPPIRPPVPPSPAALRRHRMTREQWQQMLLEQGALCAICRRHGWEYVIDHNHETGQVRGLLCHGCNTALGILGDCPETLQRAIDYLTERGHYAGLSPRATRAPETEGAA